MTSNSNPITDILTAFEKYMSLERNYTKPAAISKVEAQQALYEAIAKAIWELPEYGDKVSLVSKREALVTLRVLFGVADVGGLEKPKGGSNV